jgi:threonine 3-dehydrogenase
MPSETDTILILGANGQIGSVLTQALRQRYPNKFILPTDIREPERPDGPFELLNVLDADAIEACVVKHRVSQIYHLAAILSAKGEEQPLRTWDVNMNGLFNVLEVARKHQVQRVFFPSSIAVFGPGISRYLTPQDASLAPTTVYGMSKVAGELWCQYYFQRYGLDVRSLRYPGIIGYQSMPGGGTTDYAVDIFHYAVQNKPYSCFLQEDSELPMMYMDDAIRATLELMEAPAGQIRIRTSYNLAGMSFSPKALAEAIREQVPDFSVSYAPDHRQAIAESWPASIDDHMAREDWGWKPAYNLSEMTADMLHQLRLQYA